MFAAREGHKEIVKLLIDRGANVDLKDHRGATASDYAQSKGITRNHMETLALLTGMSAAKRERDGKKKISEVRGSPPRSSKPAGSKTLPTARRKEPRRNLPLQNGAL